MAASKRQRQLSRNQSAIRRAAIESLEQRLVFSTITVNTLADNTDNDNFMSLREAVELMNADGDANAALGRSLTAQELAQIDTADPFGTNNLIVFDENLSDYELELLSTLDITGTMTIDGGEAVIELIGDGTFRAFTLTGSANLTLDRLHVAEFGLTGSNSDADGGAIYTEVGTSLTINRTTFHDNHATGSSGNTGRYGTGGAIHAKGTLTITNSSFHENSAIGGDGITFEGGNGYGGAIYASGTVSITNSTFFQNTAMHGTGVMNDGVGAGGALYLDGNATINFSTFSNNSATYRGSSVYVNDGETTITNSILGQATADAFVHDLWVDGGANVTGSNNLIRETNAGNAGVISAANPMLNAPADNGGEGPTIKPQAGSPVINAADATTLETDQLGRPRVVGAAADLGAYETAYSPVITSADSTAFTIGGVNDFTITTITDGATPTLSYLGDLPDGVTFTDNGDGTATLSGTPDAGTAGDYVITITAANGTSPDAEQTFTLSVEQIAQITSVPEATFQVGVNGTFTITTTGHPAPALSYTGTLPAGVTFHDNGDGTATLSGIPTGADVGNHEFTVFADNGVGSVAQQEFTLIVAPVADTIVTTGNGSGGSILVKNPDGTVKFSIENPFPAKSTPRRLATGDVNGDGVADIIVASGKRTAARIYIYDGDSGNELTSIEPFGNYKGGVYVTTGDVDNDGVADIIVAAGKRPGSKATIKVYSGTTYDLIADVWAFDTGGEVRLASADLDGDGHAEVIATKGNKVRVFDGQSMANNISVIQSEFRPFAGYTGGLFVAAGDIDNDGQADIIVSQASGTRPWIAVFNGDDNGLQKKFRVNAFNGTTIASHDYNNDGHDDIVAVTRSNGKNVITVFSGADDSILSTSIADEKGRLFIA